MIAALLLLAQVAEARPLNLHVEVTPEPFTLGELVEWKIEVEHEPRDVYTLPPVEAPQLAFTGAPVTHRAEKDGHALTTFVLRFADLSTLEPKLPDVTLRVDGPEGPRQIGIRGRALRIRSLVKEEGEQTPEHAHHGPKPPVPVMVRSWLWLGLLLGLLAITGAVALYRFWRKKRLELLKIPAAPPLAPEDEAIRRLVGLREAARFGRPTIFAVSEIARAYLGARFQFDALDRTSEELLLELRGRKLARVDLAALEGELRWEDLVKFAKVEPTGEECAQAIERAIELVNLTRPRREAA